MCISPTYDNLKTAEEVYQGQDFINFFVLIKSSISGRSKLIINHVLKYKSKTKVVLGGYNYVSVE